MNSQNLTNTPAQGSSRNVHRRSLPLLMVLAAAAALAIAPHANAGPAFLPNRNLVSTNFATNNLGVVANCAAAGCVSANVPLFAPAVLPIVCPGAVGTTCTFYIHIETDDGLSQGDQGRFRFLVGGVAPNPGPTFPGGLFIWDNHDPNSALAVPLAHSYAVTAFVTNNAANQVWPVSVTLSCADNAGTAAGCNATTFLANLEVSVYVP